MHFEDWLQLVDYDTQRKTVRSPVHADLLRYLASVVGRWKVRLCSTDRVYRHEIFNLGVAKVSQLDRGCLRVVRDEDVLRKLVYNLIRRGERTAGFKSRCTMLWTSCI
jgi:hypothetical protein